MKARADRPYWERACHFFRSSGLADSEGSYFLHNKNSGTVRIGIMCQNSVSVSDSSISHTEDGHRTIIDRQPDVAIFKQVEKLLREEAPCFFIVSPDIYRRYSDESLPQILLVQPAVEFTFSPEQIDGAVSYARDPALEQQGAAMLRSAHEQPIPARPTDAGVPGSFSQLSAGWTPDEDDGSFSKRLDDAIDLLRDHPDGKMTLTRAYQRASTSTRSPFELYELHARRNGEYAFSHFLCLRDDAFSLGTTPENVFEVSGRTLSVDVVAATCRSSDDEEFLARELYENPKQVKEHTSSLKNRRNRFLPFCADGSIRVVQEMQLKRLRNVCHLHSVFTGELLPEVTIFDLMGNIFPLLGARPKELLPVADSQPAPHRYYGGVVGHLHLESGGCFLNIRNALLDRGLIHAKVGVGVISESDSYSELVETRDKLSGVLEAIHLWQQRKGEPDHVR